MPRTTRRATFGGARHLLDVHLTGSLSHFSRAVLVAVYAILDTKSAATLRRAPVNWSGYGILSLIMRHRVEAEHFKGPLRVVKDVSSLISVQM